MKHVFLSFLLVVGAWLCPATAQAQPSGPDSLSQKLTSIFAPLDKSQVPTGYLYEAGIRFLEPRYYNGVLSDSNRATWTCSATCGRSCAPAACTAPTRCPAFPRSTPA